MKAERVSVVYDLHAGCAREGRAACDAAAIDAAIG